MAIRKTIQILQSASESIVNKPKRQYYHGSNTELPIGTVLMPRVDSRVDDKAEQILEDNKPEGYISRSNSVFMAVKPEETHELGGTEYEFVYQVQPLGPVSKHALYFLHEVDDPHYAPSSDKESMIAYQNECAYKYWTEKPVPNEMTEYLTTSARIIRKVQ